MKIYYPLMKQFYATVIVFLLTPGVSFSQPVKLSCIKKERKSDYGKYPILIQTCFLKNFKFISTSYPDGVGRYFPEGEEHEVFALKNNKYVETTNSKVFNKKQSELLDTINARILRDFNKLRADSNTKECLTEIDSIPVYKMDDIKISFNNGEIWFEVNWGLSGGCRAAGGAIVCLKINDIKQYLN
jgi:hypothetical protein